MFIYTTYIVQNYVRVITVWLWALILALGIGEGIRGLKRGVPFMVESTPVSAVHSTVESQHSWVGAPPGRSTSILKVKNKLKRRNEYCLAVTIVQFRDVSWFFFFFSLKAACITVA